MFEKLRTFGKELRRELDVYRVVLRDRRTPVLSKFLLGAAIAYLLLPFDLIPDFIPVIGHLDDAVIVPGLVLLALTMIPKEIIRDARESVSP